MEISPASDWCQRWSNKTHSWRHKSDGGFDPDDYEVHSIEEKTAKAYILAHHYSGTYPAAKQRYGLFHGDQLAGVAVLGIPTQAKVLTNVFPDLEPYRESVELARLILADRVPGNGESWFLSQVFSEAAHRDIRGIVSFADPCPRFVAGRLLFPGHIGTIYQATNAIYAGRATPRSLIVLPTGETLNDRAAQKVRRQERGHDYVEAKLVGLGASPIHLGQSPASWLLQALNEVGARRINHGGNHRYVFTLGVTRHQRRSVRVALSSETYPKQRDAA